MHRLLALVAICCFSLPALAQLKDLNLNSLFGAVQGVAKSQEVGSMKESEEIAIGKEVAASTLGVYRIIADVKLQRYLNRVGKIGRAHV